MILAGGVLALIAGFLVGSHPKKPAAWIFAIGVHTAGALIINQLPDSMDQETATRALLALILSPIAGALMGYFWVRRPRGTKKGSGQRPH